MEYPKGMEERYRKEEQRYRIEFMKGLEWWNKENRYRKKIETTASRESILTTRLTEPIKIK